MLASVHSQLERRSCFQNHYCVDQVINSGFVVDLERYCCRYNSPGLTRGISYEHFGIETCFSCPNSKCKATIGLLLVILDKYGSLGYVFAAFIKYQLIFLPFLQICIHKYMSARATLIPIFYSTFCYKLLLIPRYQC